MYYIFYSPTKSFYN